MKADDDPLLDDDDRLYLRPTTFHLMSSGVLTAAS
jgi:hypothetical protein